jgi:hypothetical protein
MTEPLELEKATFTLDFWRGHAEYNPRGIINVDETTINFDIPPRAFGVLRDGTAGAVSLLTTTSSRAGSLL